MLILQTNKKNILLRCFAVLFMILFVYPFFIKLGLQQFNNGQIIFWKVKLIHLFYLIIIGLSFYLFIVIISVLSILKVEIDYTSNTITFISLLNRKTISVKEIDKYYTTIHKNQYKEWNGILLNLKQGKSIQLAGQNLNSIGEFQKYLEDNLITCQGVKKMRFPFN